MLMLRGTVLSEILLWHSLRLDPPDCVSFNLSIMKVWFSSNRSSL